MVLPAAPWPFLFSISISHESLYTAQMITCLCISADQHISCRISPTNLFFSYSSLRVQYARMPLCLVLTPTFRHAGVIMAARKIFRSVDGDGNGKLDRQELGMLVQELRASMGAHLLNGPAVSILYVSCLCFSALLAVWLLVDQRSAHQGLQVSISLLFWRSLFLSSFWSSV